MGKSVYSLVLSDEVVAAVDEMAFKLNASRSSLINQVLAEYVSLVTPEKRMRDIYEELSQLLLNEGYQVVSQPSDSMLSVKSVLRYKYKPTIRYCVELAREQGESFGEIRVLSRTQSQGLLEALEDFYGLWVQLEKAYWQMRKTPGKPVQYIIENGRFHRQFRLSQARRPLDEEEVGKAIAEYIQAFDTGIKLYFSLLHEPADARRQVQKVYSDYVRGAQLPI